LIAAIALVLFAMLGMVTGADDIYISDGRYVETREDGVFNYDVHIEDGITLTLFITREGWVMDVGSDRLDIWTTRVISHDTWLIGPVVP
jgi:hypothetical protein